MEDTANHLLVGVPKCADDAEPRQRGGWFGDTIISQLMPRYFENAARGSLFIFASAAAGVTLAAPGNNLPTIWNTAGSNKLVIPVRVILGYVSATHAAGHLAWAYQNNTGANIGTASPFSVFTDIAPQNCLIGGAAQRANGIRFSTTQTFTAPPTYLRPAGLNTAALVATTAVAPWPMTFDEDGTLVVTPGNAIQLCANAAIAMVASVAIVALVISIPPGFET